MSNEYPQPVEPMSRAEAILRGDETVVPMSRIEDLLKQLIAGGGGGGSTVTITTDYQTGTKIATLTIDGTDYNVYIPTDQIGSIVSITTDYQSGTKIATLTIDNTDYNIYIPTDQVGNTNYSGTADPSAAIGNDKDLYFKIATTTNSETLYTESWSPRSWGEVVEVQYSDVVSVFNTVTVNIHNIGDLTFNYSDLPVSNDPATDGYTWHDEWNFVEFKISRDDTYIYFTITKWEGTGTWVFQSCSISYSVVAGVTDSFIKKDGEWIPYIGTLYGSPTEHVIGKWTDGRPLYRLTQTVTLSSAISAGHNQILQLDTTYEIHSASCIGLEDGIYYLLPYATAGSCVTPLIDDAGYFDLYITGNAGFNSGSKFEITIEYTKSTD